MRSKKLVVIGIYKLVSPNGIIYVGQSKDVYKRWDNNYAKLKCKDQPKLYNSLKFYGWENFKKEILEKFEYHDEDLLNRREIYWGNLYEVLNKDKGLNTYPLGKQGKQPEESIKKRIEKIIKSIFQFDLQGNFIQKFKSAIEAVKFLGKGNSNNINDCARGKYKSTYGYQWRS